MSDIIKLKHVRKEYDDGFVALHMVQLDGFANREISELSGGQQQRVAIARAIVNQPKVLLLDESLSALDKRLRKDMQFELREIQKKLGITFIFVTHDQRECDFFSDEAVEMNMFGFSNMN